MANKVVALLGAVGVLLLGLGAGIWFSTRSANAACLVHEGPVGGTERPAFAKAQAVLTRQGADPLILDVEIADTATKRAYGLMFVRKLGDACGMVFIYPREEDVAFWMRNTFIPLDLLYFDGKGLLHHIHYGAKPHDETPLPSGAPTQYVLEIAAGAAQRHGLQVGDQLKLLETIPE